MNTLPLVKAPRLRALCAVAVLALSSAPAVAQDYYRYTYTGNLFTMTFTDIFAGNEPGNPTQGRSFYLQSINAEILALRPLSGNVTMADIHSVTLSIVAPQMEFGLNQSITFPAQPPEPCGGGCAEGPYISGGLQMSGFNDLNNGQPTSWEIWAETRTIYPTGRHDTLWLRTSSAVDELSGGYEAFSSYEGGLIRSAGVWAMVVPEPSSYLLMLGGVAMVAGLARRRSRLAA